MSTDNRKTRVEESRDLNSRDAETRRFLQMTHQDPLYVDLSKKPLGYEYRLIRDSCLGQHDPYRLAYMARKGYTPVPADRHPELTCEFFPGQDDGPMKGVIYRGGLLLCERPEEYSDIERRTLEQVHASRMASMPGQDHFMDDPTMPIRVLKNETSIQHGYEGRTFAD